MLQHHSIDVAARIEAIWAGLPKGDFYVPYHAMDNGVNPGTKSPAGTMTSIPCQSWYSQNLTPKSTKRTTYHLEDRLL